MAKKKDSDPNAAAHKDSKSQRALDRLFARAVEVVGSEERARAMLKAGTLKLKLPRGRRDPGKQWSRCGAYARSTGKLCQAPGNGRGGRCKLHGGKSTGPKTEEGIRRLQEAMKQRWRAWRAAQGIPSEW